MPDEPNYRALAELRQVLRRFLAFSEQEARAAGVAPQQHQLLLALKGLPPTLAPTVGTLAEQLLLRHHSAVELVGRTEKRGLVRRVRDEVDRRHAHVVMTPRGERVLRALALAHRNELRTTGPALITALSSVIDGSAKKTRRRRLKP